MFLDLVIFLSISTHEARPSMCHHIISVIMGGTVYYFYIFHYIFIGCVILSSLFDVLQKKREVKQKDDTRLHILLHTLLIRAQLYAGIDVTNVKV